MDRSQESFETYVTERVRSDPQALVYGVTSAPGDAAVAALTDEDRAERPGQLWTAMSFGEALPDRVVRAILVARLANFLDGHAAVRGRVAHAVAEMLDDPSLPAVSAQSNGGSGEVLALGTLFFELEHPDHAERQGAHGSDQRIAVRGGAGRRRCAGGRPPDRCGRGRVRAGRGGCWSARSSISRPS